MTTKWIATGIAALTLATAVMTGPAAMAQSRQDSKNTARNLGIGLGAGAAYEAIKGKGTNALILGAGAAYAAKKYEDTRKEQNQHHSYHHYSHHHTYHHHH